MVRNAVIAIGLFAAPVAARADEPTAVDKVVAFVGSRPITLSEVELEYRLAAAAAGDGAAAAGPVRAGDLAELLPDLVARTAILRGMRTQYVDTLDPERVERDLQRMRDAFESREEWDRFLARLELSEEEVRERRRRVLEATSILDTAVRDKLNVTPQQIEAFLAENPGIEREEARRRLVAEREVLVREELLEQKRRESQARITDPIVPGPRIEPRPDGTPVF